jgi:hypothetical protein
MTRFWPVGEPSQADYERLRAVAVSGGELPNELVAARFSRRGLAGLVAWSVAEPVFAAVVSGAERPDWTPYADPRLEMLANTYRLLLAEVAPESRSPLTALEGG